MGTYTYKLLRINGYIYIQTTQEIMGTYTYKTTQEIMGTSTYKLHIINGYIYI